MATNNANNAASTAKKVPIHLQSSQNRLLIKNGRIVNDDYMFDADIFIENGTIAQIGHNLIVPGGVRVIDVKSTTANQINYVIPGGIDSHTHLQSIFMNQQSADDYYSGTKAAMAGGTTCIMNFAFTSKKEPSLLQAYERERKLADERVCCDYSLHIAIAEWIEGQTDKEMAILINEHGVNSFKIFLCYDMQLSDKAIIRVLETCLKYGATVIAHCENGDIIEFNANKLIQNGITGPEGHILSRPECVEAEATHRVSMLAEQVGCPVMIAHVMSKSATKIISDEKTRNAPIFGETLAATLGTNGTHCFNKCWRHAAAHVMSPPLRPDPTTPDYMMDNLATGNLHIVGSDHFVVNSHQKAVGEHDFRKIPNGVNGVEERMMITWQRGVRAGKIDPCKFVAVTSTNAAKLFNMYPKKGRIQVGSDADLVIFGHKPKIIKAETHNSKCDFNIFEGFKVDYSPIVVVSNGRVALDQTGMHVTQGSGRFIARQPFSQMAFGALRVKSELKPTKVDRSSILEQQQASAELAEKMASLQVNMVAAGQDPRNFVVQTQQSSPRPESTDGNDPDGYHSRQTKSGVRNMQDSTFKLSGEQMDDKQQRSNIRVSGQPPGGRSSGIW